MVCTKAKISEDFKEQLQECVSSHRLAKAHKEPKFPRQSVDSEHVCGYVLERPCLFLTESEYLDKFGIEPKHVPSLKIAEVLDVNGELIRGVTMLNPDQPYRSLRLMSSTTAVMSERAQTPQQQLRSTQGQEMCDHLRGAILKETKGLFSPLSAEQLRDLATQAKNRKEEEAARANLEAPFEAQALFVEEQQQSGPAPGILGPQPKCDAEESDHETEAADGQSIGLGVLSCGRRVRAKCKSKAKAKNAAKPQPKPGVRASRKKAFLSPSKHAAGGAGSVARGQAESIASSARLSVAKSRALDGMSAGEERLGKVRRTPATSLVDSDVSNGSKEETFITNGRRWLQECDLSKFVKAVSMGNEKYQLKRAKQALENINPHSADYLRFAAHLDKIESAEALQAGNIGKHSKETRTKLIGDLDSDSIVWPAEVRSALLACWAREWRAAGAKDPEELKEIVWPEGSQASSSEEALQFDPLRPRLQDAGLDDVNCAKIFTRLMVNETMIPMLMQGEKRVKELSQVVEVFLKAGCPGGGTVTAAMSREVVTCLSATRALTSTEMVVADDIAALDAVMAAKDSTKALLKDAIRLSCYYRSVEAELRRNQVAQTTFGPRVRELHDKMCKSLEEENVPIELLQEAFQNINEWREALRASATLKLEEKIVEGIEFLQRARMTDVLLLEELVRLMAGGVQNFCASSEVLGLALQGSSSTFLWPVTFTPLLRCAFLKLSA